MLALMWSILGNSSRDAMAAPRDGCPELIVETFGEQSDAACSVAWCESKYDEYATGSAGEKGYFQVHPTHGVNSSYDPETNVRFAYHLSKGGYDWSHWSCRPY